MEVDKVAFYPLFLDILTDISESHFVAFDLEVSGIPSKNVKNAGPGRPSLQQRYIENKQAADKFQILQIGITCVQQDAENGKYVLKPYNFELSPIIEQKGLDVERIFSFQSGAVDFLLNVGFDMGLPFTAGVPYLSREESREAREKHEQRHDKSAIADIQLKPTETESLAFVSRVRNEINNWLGALSVSADYLNIGGTSGAVTVEEENGELTHDLSRFEKRLVHQLVRAEFPELVTITKRGYIHIVQFDKEREDRIAATRRRELEERIARQKGFRWVIEALAGNDISQFDVRECAYDPVTGEQIFVDIDEFKSQFYRASTLLRRNPRPIVGHNCFLDLVYIYRTFIGELPDTVEEFQEKIHKLWPMVVDTKYMSTHNCGDINPVSSLEQIAETLSNEKTPVIEVDKEHKKYEEVEVYHEAGYDSFMTAQIAARLSPKLYKTGNYDEIDDSSSTSAEKAITNGVHGLKLTATALHTHNHHVENGTVPPSDPDSFVPSVEGGRWKRRGDPTLPLHDEDDPFHYDPANLNHHHRDMELEKAFEGGMPAWSSAFWRVYGNKLRVFGTDEAVCVLDGSDEMVEGEDNGFGQGGVAVV